MGDRATPIQPLQHLQRSLEGAIRDLQSNSRQFHQHLDNSLKGLCLASLSGGIQTPLQSVPVRKDALVSAAALAAKFGALFQQPKQQEAQLPTGDGGVVCLEFTKGKRRVYRRKKAAGSSSDGKGGEEGFDVTDDQVTHRARMADVFADYLLPQGFPDSVAPQYATYMAWRGVQYFFGGAMSVFTTRSLLAALGMSKHTGEAAAAINWVLKDGAGRLGRFLFARWGRQLDCELKQFRLAGDVLMEAGAALELATVLVPQAFLALACTANLAKNLAAVAASATRAPIYRTFAKQNNLADITAKGESVANLADILGTAFGIALAKMNLPVVPTFCLLSVGYLISSRKEVDSVVLPYLNRARLSYTCRTFLDSGEVPEPLEANAREPLTPWSDPIGSRIVLGASVAEACADPAALEGALRNFPGRQYAITYRPDTRKAYVLLQEGVSCQQMLRATFDAQVLIFMLNRSSSGAQGKGAAGSSSSSSGSSGSNGASAKASSSSSSSSKGSSGGAGAGRSGKGGAARPLIALDRAADALGKGPKGPASALRSKSSQSISSSSSSSSSHEEAVRYVAAQGAELYKQFEKQAVERGWKMNLTMLNASETRLRMV